MTWQRLEYFPDTQVCAFENVPDKDGVLWDFYLVIHPDHVTMIVVSMIDEKRTIVLEL